jgi:CPA2 family monovalent cation:H+ antiporter-2
MDHLVLEMGLALSLIALAAAFSYWLRFSVVPLLILIGMAVGPHAPKIGPLDFRFIQSAPLIEFMGAQEFSSCSFTSVWNFLSAD